MVDTAHTFDELQRVLVQAHALTDAAEAHGTLVGSLCASRCTLASSSWTGGVGTVGDKYERHADAVVDAVVRRESAEALSYSSTLRARALARIIRPTTWATKGACIASTAMSRTS